VGCTNTLAGGGAPSDDGEDDSTLYRLFVWLLKMIWV